MQSILEFLFSSELTFPGSGQEERELGDELDAVMKLRCRIDSLLEGEQIPLWEAYQAKMQQMHDRDCRMEFDRGFLTAVHLVLEIFGRSAEGTI